MLIKNSEQRFGLVTKLLHWAIALLILGLIWLGWYMVDLTYYDRWYNDSLHYHKSLGMIALFLAVFMIAWQIYTPVPDTLAQLKPLTRTAARVMHFTLFAMMILIPISGYFISTSAGLPSPR